VYKTSNPAVLLENSSFNRKVPVEVVIGRDLASPEPDFNIEFQQSSVLKSEIQYKLNDKDKTNASTLFTVNRRVFKS
jgi:hypothetical protein